MKDVKTKVSDLKQEIAVDQDYNIVNRLHEVNLNIPSDKINNQK